MKVKILKPVVLGGKLYHKIGAVVEAPDKHAQILTRDGWAEKASASTPITPGATVQPPARPPVNPQQEADAEAGEAK